MREGSKGVKRDIESAMWDDLFHNFDHSKTISIAASGDPVHRRRLTVTYQPTDIYLPVSARGKGITTGRGPVTFRWNVSGRNPIEITPRIEEGTLKAPPVPEPPTETFFFAANHTYSSVEAATRLSRLSKKSQENDFIRTFTKHYPDVEKLTLPIIRWNTDGLW